MDNLGNIEIRISGSRGNIELTPENYDINDIIAALESAEDLLFPSNKKDRPLISYSIEAGSVRHIIRTSLQAVIGFNAIIGQVGNTNSIDFMEVQSAKAIETLQENAIKNNYEFRIRTSVEGSNELKINSSSKLKRTQFYFYGTLTNAGGKNKANIHLDTEQFGLLTIETEKKFLGDKEENLLYKEYGVRAIGKQNLQTTEIDKQSLKLIELIDYNPKFDQDYLSSLLKKASSSWKGISDADDWLGSIRGTYEG